MMTEMWMRFFYSPGVNLVNSHRASWGKDRCRCDKLFVYEIRVWCLLYTIPAILRKVAASMLRYYEVCEQLFYRKRKWITRPFDKFGWFQENSDELLTILQNLRRMNNFMGFNGWNHFGVFELKSCTRSWGIGSSTISRCTIFQNSAVEVSTISQCTIFQNSVEVPTISCGTIFRNSVGSTTISQMFQRRIETLSIHRTARFFECCNLSGNFGPFRTFVPELTYIWKIAVCNFFS